MTPYGDGVPHSSARIANLRRERARRPYRSIAFKCVASCSKIVANLSVPCGGFEGNNIAKAAIGLGPFRRRTSGLMRMFASES